MVRFLLPRCAVSVVLVYMNKEPIQCPSRREHRVLEYAGYRCVLQEGHDGPHKNPSYHLKTWVDPTHDQIAQLADVIYRELHYRGFNESDESIWLKAECYLQSFPELFVKLKLGDGLVVCLDAVLENEIYDLRREARGFIKRG